MMLRRGFLSALLAPLARSAPRLKITDVRVVPLKRIRTAGTLEPAWNPGGRMEIATGGGSYVEVRTDQGLTGIGPGLDPTLLEAVNAQLKGQDPFDIERHAARLRQYAMGPNYRGFASVDIALWDLIGKAGNQPLYKLFGGGKEKVIPYASMIVLSTPEERARMASSLLSQGWQAIKLRLHYETMREDVRMVEAVRKAVGDRMTIMVDANQAQSAHNWQPGVRWTFERALATARELERLDCYWLEEPLPRYAFDQLAELNRQVNLPLAGGENNKGLHEFRAMCEQGVYDILQPESMVGEGLTNLRKIGVLAELWNKRVVPHHGGGDIGTIAHLHLVASWPHAPFFELLHDPPIGSYEHRFAIMADPPKLDKQGFLAVPEGPGLGVTIAPGLAG
jgi:D-galactarolactone cycloisomerase